MRAISSSLTIRFYEKDGWNKNVLLDCIKEEHRHYAHLYLNDPFPDDDTPYWTFAPGGVDVIDLDKLMIHITTLERKFNDYPEDNDREFIRKFI